MNIQKAITGMVSVAALTLAVAGASFAQTFGYTTVFSPNPIGMGPVGNFITVENGANSAINAGGIGSAINLSNFVETSNVGPASPVNFSDPFTIALSVTPIGGSVQTQDFTGTISGTYDTNQSLTAVVFGMPSSLTYDFGALGKYTVSNLAFVQPGPQGSTTKGSIAGVVHYAPAAVPEPGTVASFLFGGLGVLGLIVRARKGSRASGLAV